MTVYSYLGTLINGLSTVNISFINKTRSYTRSTDDGIQQKILYHIPSNLLFPDVVGYYIYES